MLKGMTRQFTRVHPWFLVDEKLYVLIIFLKRKGNIFLMELSFSNYSFMKIGYLKF